jgi:hypothetical protein
MCTLVSSVTCEVPVDGRLFEDVDRGPSSYWTWLRRSIRGAEDRSPVVQINLFDKTSLVQLYLLLFFSRTYKNKLHVNILEKNRVFLLHNATARRSLSAVKERKKERKRLLKKKKTTEKRAALCRRRVTSFARCFKHLHRKWEYCTFGNWSIVTTFVLNHFCFNNYFMCFHICVLL